MRRRRSCETAAGDPPLTASHLSEGRNSPCYDASLRARRACKSWNKTTMTLRLYLDEHPTWDLSPMEGGTEGEDNAQRQSQVARRFGEAASRPHGKHALQGARYTQMKEARGCGGEAGRSDGGKATCWWGRSRKTKCRQGTALGLSRKSLVSRGT
jgi:hypothetical protein